MTTYTVTHRHHDGHTVTTPMPDLATALAHAAHVATSAVDGRATVTGGPLAYTVTDDHHHHGDAGDMIQLATNDLPLPTPEESDEQLHSRDAVWVAKRYGSPADYANAVAAFLAMADEIEANERNPAWREGDLPYYRTLAIMDPMALYRVICTHRRIEIWNARCDECDPA